VAYFKVLSQHLPGGTEENTNDVRIVGVPAEIGNGHLPKMSTALIRYLFVAYLTIMPAAQTRSI
jgi:hypothetical protein